ncbi:hypothetical protein C8R45DRAFT_1088961 [Mycena sanguinolenta]|nr:hypothetical protein C8R45DRAFT_1088961 [Mycena sanguinolenta]
MEFLPPPPKEVIDIADDTDGDSGDDDSEGVQVNEQALPEASIAEKNLFSDFESDDEDDEDESEEEVKPLIALSTDIKADFEAVLKDGFDFDGVFAFSQRYKIGGAPNPCLNIEGLGTIGIPLSVREAHAIISVSQPVHFENPAWDAWIQTEAGVAVSTALTASADVKPSFILKKLVIHEQSSHTARYKDEASDRKIGDFIVFLPGHFEGAQLQLRHGGQIKTVNFAHQSGLTMSVVAAYSGVEHTLAGVSSGYRLSLVYDIVQPITHVWNRPTLPAMQGATRKLQHILRSWKQMNSDEAPEMLACLLQHKYRKSSNFSAKSLTGSDGLLISHLYPLARELKFRIYLAHIEATVSVSCEIDYGYPYPYEDSDIDEEQLVCNSKKDADEADLVVTEIVDLRGMPVTVDLELQFDDLLNGSVTDKDHDHQEIEKSEYEDGNANTNLPTHSASDMAKEQRYDERIRRRNLRLCVQRPTGLDNYPNDAEFESMWQGMHEFEERRHEAKIKTSVQVLMESADRWNEPQILLQTLKACGVDKNTDFMGPEGFVSAYQAFGWDVLKDFCGQAMANDESNARRHALLARLTQMGAEQEDEDVSSWCEDHADCVLRSLGEIDAAQIPWLADEGLARGGEFLRDVTFPQLHAQQLDETFWVPFLLRIKSKVDTIPTISPDVVNDLILECVTQAIRTLPTFPRETVPDSSYTLQEKSSDAILEVIKLCVETKNAPLCAEIFTKLRDTTRPRPWLYYAELSPALIRYTQGKPALDAIFKPFFVDVIDVMVSGVRHSSDGKPITLCPFTDEHKSILIKAARKVGGITILKERMTAVTLKGHDSSTIQALVRTIVEKFPRQQLQEGVPKQAYDELIIALVFLAIDTFDMPSLTKLSSNYSSVPANPADQMIGMLNFCFEVGAENQCKRLLLRFVPPPKGSTVAQHVSKILAPFMSVLRPFILSKGLNFQTEPYRMFAAAVVQAFAEQVMEQTPSEVVSAASVQTIGCRSCAECPKLRAFFASDARTIRFSRVQGIRTHLERELQNTSSWGVTWETIRSGSPYTLEVAKPPSMTAAGLWTANSQAGIALLQDLGDAETQARILGAAYPTVHARIHGEKAPPDRAGTPCAPTARECGPAVEFAQACRPRCLCCCCFCLQETENIVKSRSNDRQKSRKYILIL